MNNTTNPKDHNMNGIEIQNPATNRLKELGCKFFQVLRAEDAKVLFEHYRDRGARLDELLLPAVRGGAFEFVRLLLVNGVAPTNEAMDEWVKRSHGRILNHLLDAGGVPVFDIILEVIRLTHYDHDDRVRLLEAILTKGRPSLTQQERDQLLEEAVDRGYGSRAQELLIEGYGANVDVECKYGTPLIIACRNQDDEHALYLIDHGADIDYRRPGRWSARTFAKRHKEVMPLTHARITRHELTKKADKKRKQIEVDAPMRRAM